MSKGFEMLLLCWRAPAMDMTSAGVWVDGVDGAEFGEGPAVLAVPELFAGPEEFAVCFLFRALWAPFAAAFSPKNTQIH